MALSIQELAKIGQLSLPKQNSNTDGNAAFEEIFQSAMSVMNQTNELQKTAEQMSNDFALGKIDNIHDVLIAQEKASVALQYTVQLKNAVLDAYNEIMRIQM